MTTWERTLAHYWYSDRQGNTRRLCDDNVWGGEDASEDDYRDAPICLGCMDVYMEDVHLGIVTGIRRLDLRPFDGHGH